MLIKVLFVEQKQLAKSRQRAFALLLEFAVFRAADLVHRFAEILGDMKAVMHDSRIQHALGSTTHARLSHGDRNSFNLLKRRFCQRFPEIFASSDRPIASKLQDAELVRVGQHRNIAVA